MHKEYMLLKLRERMKVLKERYHKACSMQYETGEAISDTTARQLRYRYLRDMQIISLLLYLLEATQAVTIEDPEALAGFDKLIEPKERFINKRSVAQ